MTTYYLSLNAGQTPSESNVAEATGSPTADAILVIGSGNVAAANISRHWLAQAVIAFGNYLLTDDPDNPGKSGAGTIPLTK